MSSIPGFNFCDTYTKWHTFVWQSPEDKTLGSMAMLSKTLDRVLFKIPHTSFVHMVSTDLEIKRRGYQVKGKSIYILH